MTSDLQADSQLVERCLRGEQKAYRELLEKYRRSVYGIVRRMVPNDEDARDLSHEAFIRAFKNLEKFDPERSFSNWLFRIATNLCIDHPRRRKLKTVPLVYPGKEGEDERTWDAVDTEPTPAEAFSQHERGRRLSNIIDSLPPVYRTVIQLRHIENRSYEEIAITLDLPMGTVKARIHRAHKLLREKLVHQKLDWVAEKRQSDT